MIVLAWLYRIHYNKLIKKNLEFWVRYLCRTEKFSVRLKGVAFRGLNVDTFKKEFRGWYYTTETVNARLNNT